MGFLKQNFFKIAILWLAFFPLPVFAHENYVLSKGDIDKGMADSSINVFNALKNPHNLQIGLIVGAVLVVVFALYFVFSFSKIGLAFDRQAKRLEPFGHVMLRVALAVSFLASAYYNTFLGPEIPLSSIPLGFVLRPVLFVLGVLLLIGLFSEVAGILGLAILVLATFAYKDYMMTYFNYFGEFLALMFFGSRIFSVDRLIFKTKSFLAKYKKWEIPIIRITYGISVLYPAVSIKILHPAVILEIVQKYHMDQIHWLFPSDPLLISLGTGLAQIAVGLFIILGFETRLNSLVTFFLYTLSILFFKEAVWPHYILLALALYLAINDGGDFSLDGIIRKRRLKKA